jgi:pimeloyl-ACP methyl ester carboxylesterase
MFKKWLLIIIVLLVALYLAGPSPSTPKYSMEMPVVPSNSTDLESYITAGESQHKLKPDNEARIVWNNDSIKQKTAYSIVYLHGFSASQEEGDPVDRNIAKEFGFNLYLSRLADHGIDTVDAMINFSVDQYWESAKQALAIGKQIGSKVILMTTSTGGTLALKLAADFPADVAAIVLMSPNIAINDPSAWILNNHWGLQIARMVLHSDYVNSKDSSPLYKQYWYPHYRLEAAVGLEELLETTMNKKTFENVKQPVDLLYFYKNEVEQDSTVKVSAMLTMFDELGTPDSLKRKTPIPGAGTHVIGSYIRSHAVEDVQREIEKFFTDVLHLSTPGISSQ